MHRELTPEQTEKLKDYFSGQYSDGCGERFEQRPPIEVADGEVYVSFWHSGNDFKLQSEQELFGLQSQGMGGMQL